MARNNWFMKGRVWKVNGTDETITIEGPGGKLHSKKVSIPKNKKVMKSEMSHHMIKKMATLIPLDSEIPESKAAAPTPIIPETANI